MRIKHKVILQVADDADMKDLLFSLDAQLAETIIDSYARVVSGKVKVALNTNEDLSLGDVAAVKGLYLKANKDCTVKLNGSTDGIALTRSSTSSGVTAKLFLEAVITQVNITAPVTEDLEVLYCAWGDAAS